MRTYVDLFFPLDGPLSSEIAKRLKEKAGLEFIRGRHDLVFEWTEFKEFAAKLEAIHAALKGTGVIYRFVSSEEEEPADTFAGWPPVRGGSAFSPRRDRQASGGSTSG